ncbi:MAG: lyase, partial [Myxococcales bacterium]|nr:lyase [Myxococcales bacterium]
DFPAGCGDGGGDVINESYIWVPGTSDGTVAKIDTRTLVEVARYNIGPSGGSESASRTAVSGDGRFVVVNSRGTGRSTAVAANVADCVDQNNDGVIQTSQNAADILPWGSDECVVWTLVHNNWGGSHQQGPRGITWTIGDWNEATCSFVNQKVWLGYLTGGGAGSLVRLDGATGAVEQTLEVPGWVGSGYAPYGGALDPSNRPWFTGLRGELVRVNVENNPIDVTRFSQPSNIQSYGMTVDPNGNPWMAGCSGPVSTYDVQSNQWISIAGTSACHRGMAIDHDFHVWVASNSPCGLVEIDGETRTLVANHTLAQCSTPIGVSVDVDGYVWLVDQAGWAWKIDTANVPAMQQIPVSGNHYVYSDMTGGQLKSVTQPPG